MTETETLAGTLIPIHEFVSQDDTRIERDEDHINRLVGDFKNRMVEHPDQHPVQTFLRVVRKNGKYLIIAGNYRYLAGLRAGLRDLPCIIIGDDLSEAEILIEMAKDNELRRDYSPIERARNIFKLAELQKCSLAEAGKLLGILPPETSKLVRVLKNFPRDLHELVGEGAGKVPFTSAYKLSMLQDEGMIRELTEKITQGLLKRDSVDLLVDQALGVKKQKKQVQKPMKISIPGLEMLIDVFEVTKLRSLLALVDSAILKLDKHGLPLQSLQAMLHNATTH
jgi:hypothetical protein